MNEEDMTSFLKNGLENALEVCWGELSSDELDDLYSSFEYDYDNEDEIPEVNSEEFISFVKDRIRYNIEYNFSNIEIVNNKLVLYRKLAFKENYLEHLNKEGKHLGIYWAWDKAYADVYFAPKYGYTKYIIKALVNQNGVDWLTSACLNRYDEEGDYTEAEIRLVKGSPIEIIGIKKETTEGIIDLDISGIKDKTFYA